jgi:uncharacterized protein YeaO (DUF488 family)
MPIKTKRWNDLVEEDDGFRLLICLYRPRGVRKEDETWHAWDKHLGPSKELHAAVYGKHDQEPMPWDEYRQKYLQEMEQQQEKIQELANRVAAGETITLLCSSACEDENRCHRSILRKLIKARLAAMD